MKDRLNQFLQLEQLSSARFAAILGIQPSSVSHILSGRNKPGFDFIEKMLLKFPGLSAEWIITGKGKMFKEPLPSVNPPVANLFKAPPVVLQPHDQPISTVSEPIFNSNTELGAAPQPGAIETNNPLSADLPHKTGAARVEKVVLFYSDKHFEEFFPK